MTNQIINVRDLRFRNPANGYIEEVRHPGLWCLLFGFFYLAYKVAWMAAAIAVAAAFFTFGLAWFIFPFLAPRMIAKGYLHRGWQLVDAGGDVLTVVSI